MATVVPIHRQRMTLQQRREQIVRDAMALFARHGFAGTTTQEIARHAARRHLVNAPGAHHGNQNAGQRGAPHLLRPRSVRSTKAFTASRPSTRMLLPHPRIS